MILLAPLLLPTGLGVFLLIHLLKSTQLPNKSLLIFALAPALGLGLTSIILFWSYVIANDQGPRLAIGLTSLVTIGLLIPLLRLKAIHAAKKKTSQSATRKSVLEHFNQATTPYKIKAVMSLLVFMFFFLHYLYYFVAQSTTDIFGGWDARYFWSLKAKLFFRDPAAWKDMFHAVLIWTHTDYPLMLPGTTAWGWNWAGHEMFAWPAVVGLTFTLSVCLFIIWYLSSYVALWSGLLAGALFLEMEAYRFWSTTQYADIPICLWMTTSAVMLLLAFRLRNCKLIFLSGLLAGLSAWTKNEGIAFLIWSAVIGLVLLATNRQLEGQEKKWVPLYFFAGIVFPLVSVLYLKFQLDFAGNEFVSTHRNVAELIAMWTDLTQIKLLGVAFLAFIANMSQWDGLWILWVIAIGLSVPSLLRSDHWVLLAYSILILVGYAAVLLITPDLMLEIRTALQRLLLHAGVLVLLFTFETFGRFEQTHST